MRSFSHIKGFISGVIVTSFVSISFSAFADSITKQIEVTYDNIRVNIGGQNITPKDADGNAVEPFSYNGTVYLPVRAVSQALGCTVSWDDSTKTVTLQAGPSSQSGNGGMKGSNGKSMSEQVETILKKLVSDGTLTQGKADSVLTYFSSAQPQDSQGAGTQGTERIDPLSQAVRDGVITQTEADTIRRAMMPEGGAGGAGGAQDPHSFKSN